MQLVQYLQGNETFILPIGEEFCVGRDDDNFKEFVGERVFGFTGELTGLKKLKALQEIRLKISVTDWHPVLIAAEDLQQNQYYLFGETEVLVL